MKVYLLKTPEYDMEKYMEVYELLESFPGPIKFIASLNEWGDDQFPFLRRYWGNYRFRWESDFKKVPFDPNRGLPLSWEELLSLCEAYRGAFQVEEESFVVVLTLRKNALNWFSAHHGKNAFVHAGDWETYVSGHHKYPIAYQVVENLMQSLMEIDTTNIPNDYVHTTEIGCMNDFCQEKIKVIAKLKSADICETCIERLLDKGVNKSVLNQALDIFEAIRKELLSKRKLPKHAEPLSILVDNDYRITLPQLDHLEFRLTPLFKTLYLLYLKHVDGIKLNELYEYKQELLRIYKDLASTIDSEVLTSRIDDLINPIGGSFSQKKSKINREITNLLGEPIARFYRIEGAPGETFKIDLPPTLIDIRY